jgi:hypothetical protein
MTPRPLLCAALLPLCLHGGCCSLARLFCGPDKSPWVSVGYATPEQTLATFLEAIRRDDVTEVYWCLSDAYKKAKGLPSLVDAAVFWEKLRKEIPYLHLLGEVPIPGQPLAAQDQAVTYELDVDGSPLRIVLARVHFLEIVYRTADGVPREASRYLDATLSGHLRVDATDPPRYDEDGNPIAILRLEQPVEFAHAGDGVRLDQLDRFAIGRQWKIADVITPEPRTR